MFIGDIDNFGSQFCALADPSVAMETCHVMVVGGGGHDQVLCPYDVISAVCLQISGRASMRAGSKCPAPNHKVSI